MNEPAYDTDAEPVVQLTDLSVAPEPYSHPPINPGFDKTKLILPVSILIAGVLISGSILYARYNAGQNLPVGNGVIKKPAGPVKIDLTNAPSLGNPNAPVTIVEFGDFQCPYCQRYFQQNQTAFVNDYVNTGKARFVWKDYAFLGQESIWAGEAARCANDQGKFWAYHDYLYSHQGKENSGAFSKVNLKKFAVTLGLNTAQFNSCLDSDKYATLLQQETQEGSTIGVNGTPATFINSKLVSDSSGQSVGAAPYATFKAVIDGILNK
jgi:protein-disulfide isomerase